MSGRCPVPGERVRVLHVLETMDVGGMERVVATLCRTLDRSMFDVRVLATKRIGYLGEMLKDDDILVECAGVPSDRRNYLASRRLVPFLRRFQPHVVHTHATHGLLYGGAAAILSGVPRLVHTEHGRVFPDKRHLMYAERWISRRLVKYVVVSEQLAGDVERHQKIPGERIAVIPNGVTDLPVATDASVEALRQSLVGQRAGPVIGVAARLVWEKGLDVLLEAWAIRKATQLIPGTLVIVGEGEKRPELETLARDLGIEESVVMPGAISNVAPFYRLLDAFVLSSVSEGLPMALLEAMAAGLPIVATRVGAVPTCLDEGKAGILVAPASKEELAAALERVLPSNAFAQDVCHELSGKILRTQLGKAARARFESKYTARAMTAQYASLYAPNSSGASS